MREELRPKKFGSENRAFAMVTDGEATFRLISDSSGNILYVGKAIQGSAEDRSRWQIQQLNYDANNNLISVLWPQNNLNAASTDFEFIWDGETTTAVTGLSQANPAVCTMASNPFVNGDKVVFASVGGMTEVNYDDTASTIYVVASAGATTFALTDLDGNNINSSGYTAYTSGGTVRKLSAVNYTFG